MRGSKNHKNLMVDHHCLIASLLKLPHILAIPPLSTPTHFKPLPVDPNRTWPAGAGAGAADPRRFIGGAGAGAVTDVSSGESGRPQTLSSEMAGAW